VHQFTKYLLELQFLSGPNKRDQADHQIVL